MASVDVSGEGDDMSNTTASSSTAGNNSFCEKQSEAGGSE